MVLKLSLPLIARVFVVEVPLTVKIRLVGLVSLKMVEWLTSIEATWLEVSLGMSEWLEVLLTVAVRLEVSLSLRVVVWLEVSFRTVV